MLPCYVVRLIVAINVNPGGRLAAAKSTCGGWQLLLLLWESKRDCFHFEVEVKSEVTPGPQQKMLIWKKSFSNRRPFHNLKYSIHSASLRKISLNAKSSIKPLLQRGYALFDSTNLYAGIQDKVVDQKSVHAGHQRPRKVLRRNNP